MNVTRFQHSLNSEWRLILDPDDRGVRERWFETAPNTGAITVRVPSVWDLWVPDDDGVGWNYQTFDAPEDLSNRDWELRFEAADYFAEVWLNGTRLGEHEGGYTPFALNAAQALRPGQNQLAVRIVDPHAKEGYGHFHPKEIPCAKENGYFSFAGIWGSVALIGLPKLHIRDIFIEPDIRRKRVTATVTTSRPCHIRATILGTPYAAESSTNKVPIEFPIHEQWSPDTPRLYTLRCELIENGTVLDQLDTRFGMREFTVKDGRFYLNTRPIFVKAALHQPDYPRSLTAPESEADARRELELAKSAGFNMLRLHIKTAPAITLNLADEIGLMLYAEPPIGWIRKSPMMRERCEREVREMILRDRNHPSVVIWGMLNETGNADYVTKGGAQTIKDDLCALARSLDPTRLIIDDSGGVNASRETARFMRPGKSELEPYDDLHIYQRAPVDRTIELYYMNSGDPDRLVFLSEFGFGGMEDLASVIAQYGENPDQYKDARFLAKMLEDSQRGFTERNLDRVLGGFSGFCAAAQELQSDAIRHQVDAIRANPKIAGFCYTQLCDAGHEFCAGVMDRWRRPKPALAAFQEVNQPLRPVIQLPKTNLVMRQEIPVTVTLTNEARIEGRADLSLQVVGPTNQVLWKKKRNVRIPRDGAELWSGAISASGSAGMHQFIVRLMQGTRIIASSSAELHVFEPVAPCDIGISVLDPSGVWAKRCLALAKSGGPLAPVQIIPPLANTIRAYPDNDLAQVLAQVKDGAVALIFGPPDDWNDLANILEPGITATSKDAVGAFLGIYHYAKIHPVFDELPARGLMRQVYRNIAPSKTFLEPTEEDICGTFDTTPIAQGNYMMEEAHWWGSDILVRRYGSGLLVFTHLRILENLGDDPVADRLWVNMLRHFSRRALSSGEAQPLHQKAVEWLRRERTQRVRRWMTIGEFPNWNQQGHSTVYPPENAIDLNAVYPGWYQAVSWRPWHSRTEDNHTVNLQDAFSPVFEYYPRFDYATGYAYTEFLSDRRETADIVIGVQDATKVWLNGQLIHETKDQIPHDQFHRDTVSALIKQGRNTVLVKVSKIPGPFKFSFDVVLNEKDPLALSWWR